jgi:hypothetical protein
VEASLTVGGRGYRLSFENERVAVYER